MFTRAEALVLFEWLHRREGPDSMNGPPLTKPSKRWDDPATSRRWETRPGDDAHAFQACARDEIRGVSAHELAHVRHPTTAERVVPVRGLP